jgi:hypothetical protein
MFMFFRFKLRVLEISQTEQAKVLQSLVMNMRNGAHQKNMQNDEQIMKHAQMQMQMQMQMEMQKNGGSNHPNQHSHANDLIDVSDDDDDDDDDDTSSESESSSDSGDESDSSSGDENEDTHDNTTKKIIFNNGGHLESQTTEHLTGDDIKVIELTEPLYPVGSSSKHNNNTNHVSDDDGDDGQDASDDDVSDGDDNDDNEDETSDDTEVKIEELPSHASLPLQQKQQEQHLETSSIDATEIKTIFKADKQQQQQHTDYNSMNVQALKQHLKTKLSAEGMQYNETAINKLNKKELIKHLTQ